MWLSVIFGVIMSNKPTWTIRKKSQIGERYVTSIKMIRFQIQNCPKGICERDLTTPWAIFLSFILPTLFKMPSMQQKYWARLSLG
jgi:hypothetical protein